MRKLLRATATAGLIALNAAPVQAECLTEHRGGTMRLMTRSAAGFRRRWIRHLRLIH